MPRLNRSAINARPEIQLHRFRIEELGGSNQLFARRKVFPHRQPTDRLRFQLTEFGNLGITQQTGDY